MNVCVTSLMKDLGNESERKKYALFLPKPIWNPCRSLASLLETLNSPAYVISCVSYMRDPLPADGKDVKDGSVPVLVK